MTYSIVGRCTRTGAFGIAVTSSSIAVASRCAWVSVLGAVITQNITDPSLGPTGLSLLRQGLGANAVLELLRSSTNEPEWRQIGVIDRYGISAVHSGSKAMPIAELSIGRSCLAIGNLLVSADLPKRMVEKFESHEPAPLAERLVLALEAGLAAGGETSDERAAGLHVAHTYDWPVVDLRVDWDDAPIQRLRELWTLYRNQQQEYEIRARSPSSAPAF